MLIDNIRPITIDDVINVACNCELVSLDPVAVKDIWKSRKIVEEIVSFGNPVYGINTGFGIFANTKIETKEITKLNRNLILSHSVALGRSLSPEIVRAAMFIRAVTLSKGFSGIRKEVIQSLLDMLNHGVIPIIPEKGSLGSSGDLCQLSHLALVLSKDEEDLDEESGQALFASQVMSGKKAMEKAGIQRLVFGAKEGLAINNGATFTTAIAVLSVYQAEYLARVADIAAALSMEALCARSDPLDPRIHQARNQTGQIESALFILKHVEGSTLINSMSQVQDAYSIRCVPQVHGAVLNAIAHVKNIVEVEINAATDNPLILGPGEAVSGGNFHGEPVGMVMDYLSIGLCELGAISERRINRLLDDKLNNGLPLMLVENNCDAGLTSGLMMPHYTAASLVLENQTLATPDSIRSLPTSAGQEDHNANAMTAARHALEILENLRQILSIELYAAVRAIDIRLELSSGKLGIGTGKIYSQIKKSVPFINGDTLWEREISKIKRMLENHEI